MSKIDVQKLVVLGDGGVGKTALTIQACLGHFSETIDPTIEDSYRKRLLVDGQACMLEVLDTAGQEEYTALRDQWIQGGEGFMIVYAVSARSTFVNVRRFHTQIHRVRDALIPEDVAGADGNSPRPAPIMIVANKADRVTEREVSTQEGHLLARSLGASFMELSAKHYENVEKLFHNAVRMIQQHKLQLADEARLSASLNKQIWNNGPESARNSGISSRSRLSSFSRSLLKLRRVSIPWEDFNTEAGRARMQASLVSAAKSNDEKTLLAYLEAGVDPGGHSGGDGSALHAGAAAGHVNIVNALLRKGAGLNALGSKGAPPLQLAAAEGHVSVVRLLIHKGADINQTSLHHGTALSAAASRGRAEVVRVLLDQHARINVTGGPYGNPLQAAAWNGNPTVIRHLLDAGVDITAKGDGDCTAPQMAAYVGNARAIRVLLDRGARVDIDAPGGKYGSALEAATKGGHYEATMLLLDAGATPLDIKNSETDHESGDQEENHEITATPSEPPPEPYLPRDDEHHDVTATLSDSVITTQKPTPSPSLQTESISRQAPLISKPRIEHSQSEQQLVASSPYKTNTLGFSTVHDSPEAAVDIVFVHGLQGHPEKTWTYKHIETYPKTRTSLRHRLFRSASTVSTNDVARTFWPYDLLSKSQDFSRARILTWGYDTRIVRDFFGAGDQQNISQHGNNLMVSLQQERKNEPDRPLIFVAHSLGGIIVKVALESSRRSTHQPQYTGIYSSLKGIVFLGTPHGGAGAANWGVLMTNIIKCVLEGPSERVLKGLQPNSELLENLRKSFLQMLEDGHFSVHSFYETRPMTTVPSISGLVVPYGSALVGHARKETSLGIPGNHVEMCKYRDSDDPGFRAVFGALQDYVHEAIG